MQNCKKKLLVIVVLSAVLWMMQLEIFSDQVYAEEATMLVSGDYQYKMLENGTAEICGYIGLGGEITIPASIEGITVSRIGDKAFYGNNVITKVTVENGIRELGNSCFWDCKYLASVYLPDSVEKIEDDIFYGNMKLKEVRLPSGLRSISDGMFCWCTSLAYIDVPISVEVIGSDAFGNCNSLLEVYLPDNVTMLKDGAFYGCKNLQRIRLSPKTEFISEQAFDRTDHLIWITNVDFRKLEIAENFSKISVLSESQSIFLEEYAFKNSMLKDMVIVIKHNNYIGKEVFSPGTILCGKIGTELETYAKENNHVFVEYIKAEGLSLNKTNVLLHWNANNTLQLSHSVSPSTATITQVGYYSSNPKVAIVDGEGKVTALTDGKAIITAVSLDNESLTASCEVTVSTALQGMSISKKSAIIYPGKANGLQLTVTSTPKNLKGWKVSWSSSNAQVAMVDQKGKVVGINAGTSIITATSSNIRVSCKVTVRPADLQGFTMEKQTTSSILLKWKRVTAVSGYTFYGYNNKTKKYQTICNISAKQNSYVLNKFISKKRLTSGSTYLLYLKPYRIIEGKSYYGKGMALKVATKPDQVRTLTLRKVKTTNATGWRISWRKVIGASGYKIYVSTNKGRTYKKVASLDKPNKTVYQLTKGKSKTTYYIRISAYKYISNKIIEGAQSKTRKIKIY